MNKIINGVANDFEFDGIETFNRWQDPTINELQQQLDKYKDVIDKIKEYIKTRKEEYNNETELSRACINGWHYCNLMNNILELLEEVE